jgi:hypothetical protein
MPLPETIQIPRQCLRFNPSKKNPDARERKKDDLTRGRTWNLLIAERIVVKRLAIGPLGQLLTD